MLTGVSRIDSIFSRSNARARAPGRSAANSSRCLRARAAICSRRARSVITMKSHGWDNPTDGAWWAAASSRPSTSAGTGSGRKPCRTSRRSAITRYTASRCSSGYRCPSGMGFLLGVLGYPEQRLERRDCYRGAALLREVAQRRQAAAAQRVLGLGRADEPDRHADDQGGLDLPGQDLEQCGRSAPTSQTAPGPASLNASLTAAALALMLAVRASRAASESLALQITGYPAMPDATVGASATTRAPRRTASSPAASAVSSQTRSVA